MTILNEKKEHIDYIKWKNVLKISRHGLVVGGSSEMVWFLGEVPIRLLLLGKSRYGLVVGGSPEMALSLGEVPRCDVTPHIG